MQTFTELAEALRGNPYIGSAYADLKPARCCSTGRVSVCCRA
jgi:hypothetical protein